MSENLSTIYQDSYNIEEDLLSLAKNYFFDEENEEIEISTLKPTIFGMFSQAVSTAMKNGVFHRNSLRDEYFLNTASMESSIYDFSKLYDYDITLATPAKMSIALSLKEEDIIKHARTGDGDYTYSFTLNKGSVFKAGDYKFMLPCSVNMNITTNITGDYIYSIAYDLNDYHLESLIPKNPYVKHFTKVINSDKWIMIRLELFQISVSETLWEVNNLDTTEILETEATWNEDKQLVGLEIVEEGKTIKNLNKVFNIDLVSENEDSDYCFFSYITDSSARIYFLEAPHYRPAFAATVHVNSVVTDGIKGNFEYTGTIIAALKYGNTYSYNTAFTEKVSENKINELKCDRVISTISDSAGGKNRPTILEIKNDLIRKVLSRDNLITERDLQYFFNDVISSTSINGGKLRFIKQRDDILRRIFSAYLLLKDSKDRIIPTNTFDLFLTFNNIDINGWKLKPGTLVVYDSGSDNYRLLEQGEVVNDYLEDSRSFIYTLPYLMGIKTSPFPRVVYYRNSVNEELNLSYKEFNNTSIPYEAVINFLKFSRNSMFSNDYTFEVNLNTNVKEYMESGNIDADSAIAPYYDDSSGSINYTPEGYFYGYQVFINIYKINKISDNISNYMSTLDEEELIGTLQLKKTYDDDSDSKWHGKISTNDSIDDTNGDLTLVKHPLTDLFDADGNATNNINISEDVRFEVVIKFNNVNGSTTNIATLETEDGLDLYFHKSLDNVIASDIQFNQNGSAEISRVGGIGTRYISDLTSSFDLQTMLKNYETIIKANIDKLENNTQVDIKFYNTFGVSRYFDVSSANLFIDLEIELKVAHSNEIDEAIKNSIADFVNNSNESGMLSFSNMITNLETTFDEINFIKVIGINQAGKQVIKRLVSDITSEMDNDVLAEYIPEYITPSLEINNNKLEYSINITYI